MNASSFVTRVGEWFYGAAEQQQARRELIQSYLGLGRVVGVALLVFSVTILYFSLMAGGFLGFVFSIPSIFGAILGYDIIITTGRGIDLLKDASNFSLSQNDDAEMMKVIKKFFKDASKDSLLLGGIGSFCFAQIKIGNQPSLG